MLIQQLLRVALLLLALSDYSESMQAPYPEAPNVGSAAQRRELAELTRDAVVETDPTRRVEKLLALRRLTHKILRDADPELEDGPRDDIARFFAETAHVAYLNSDHSRGKGELGSMPTHISVMPRIVPVEMVALQMTEPRHWVEALYRKMHGNNSLAGDMTKVAGGFDTSESSFPMFMHLRGTLDWRSRNNIVATTEYDGLITELMSANRLAAALHLLSIQKGTLDDDGAFEEFLNLRRKMLELGVRHNDIAFRHRRESRGQGGARPFPYDDITASSLRELAERPEWSVHLYVLSFMAKGTAWYDQEIIDRIAAHNNPVSMRFLAAKGMIEAPGAQAPATEPAVQP